MLWLDGQHLRMALRPCGHMACLTCCRSLAAGQESFACPFCRTTIVAEVRRISSRSQGLWYC